MHRETLLDHFHCLNQRPSSEGIETGLPPAFPVRPAPRLNQRPSSEGIETCGKRLEHPFQKLRFPVSISALAPKGLKQLDVGQLHGLFSRLSQSAP